MQNSLVYNQLPIDQIKQKNKKLIIAFIIVFVERKEFSTLIDACRYAEEKAGKLSSKFFCKHCFGKDDKEED